VEYLPAYAPELNPAEYIWSYWKQHQLPNVCPKDYWHLGETARKTLKRMRRPSPATHHSFLAAGQIVLLMSLYYAKLNSLKSIDVFRSDPRYGGDGNRIDLAFAIYALCHGANETEVGAAIRSRDLTHKGNEKRQDDYIGRTIKKALGRMEIAGRG
jgi:hypothetical protein